MTEEEAKTKWCPHVRYSEDSADSNASNRGPGNASDWLFSRCIGSACMMWRNYRIEEFVQWPGGALPSGDGWAVNKDDRPVAPDGAVGTVYQRQHGYCGLAGKP